VARDDWRLRVELADEGAFSLAKRLHLIDSHADELVEDLRHRRLAVTHDGETVHVYASSSQELETARKVIERELADLRIEAREIVTEHWLEDEERWDDEPRPYDLDQEVLSEGYAPWEVRIQAADHEAAHELADQLESEGYGVVRRWTYVIAGCATKEEADALAARLHGEVEPGGELVYETAPGNPFAIFGGLGGSGTPI
jgi:hypothetical protein